MTSLETTRPTIWLEDIAAIVGSEAIETSEEECAIHSGDILSDAKQAAVAIIRPGDTAALAGVIEVANRHDLAIVARGGGMSYTDGYLPQRDGSVIIDLSGMTRIVQISEEDMTVQVEAGVTWQSLDSALARRGLRTPFWGTMVGAHSTIGGAMAYDAVFWGSARSGSAVENVLALKVVTGTGQIIQTGGLAHQGGSAVNRAYGPDLTGIFLADSGVLGIKAEIVLPLEPRPTGRTYISFDFANPAAMIAAMSEVCRAGLASECFAFDHVLTSLRTDSEGLAADVRMVRGVMRNARGPGAALKELLGLIRTDKTLLTRLRYPLHVICEGRSATVADLKGVEVRDICRNHGGEEIQPLVPKVLAGQPFAGVNGMIGPRGERWMPLHGIVPHSKAQELLEAIQSLVARHQQDMDGAGIRCGFLTLGLGRHRIVVEVVFFWPDALRPLPLRYVDSALLKKMPAHEDNVAARTLMEKIKAELNDVYASIGAGHIQIGKLFPFGRTLRLAEKQTLLALKQEFDPKGILNPGGLSL